jgi:hypothetical protein
MVGEFSPGTLASSTTKTGRHDIAEILLKVALNIKSNQIKYFASACVRVGLRVKYGKQYHTFF